MSLSRILKQQIMDDLLTVFGTTHTDLEVDVIVPTLHSSSPVTVPITMKLSNQWIEDDTDGYGPIKADILLSFPREGIPVFIPLGQQLGMRQVSAELIRTTPTPADTATRVNGLVVADIDFSTDESNIYKISINITPAGQAAGVTGKFMFTFNLDTIVITSGTVLSGNFQTYESLYLKTAMVLAGANITNAAGTILYTAGDTVPAGTTFPVYTIFESGITFSQNLVSRLLLARKLEEITAFTQLNTSAWYNWYPGIREIDVSAADQTLTINIIEFGNYGANPIGIDVWKNTDDEYLLNVDYYNVGQSFGRVCNATMHIAVVVQNKEYGADSSQNFASSDTIASQIMTNIREHILIEWPFTVNVSMRDMGDIKNMTNLRNTEYISRAGMDVILVYEEHVTNIYPTIKNVVISEVRSL